MFKLFGRLALIPLLICSVASASAAEPGILGDFATGVDGFSNCSQADSVAGLKCITIVNKNQEYVDTEKLLEGLDKDFESLEFKARLKGKGQLAIRLNDSTGQTHLQRPKLAADGSWHSVQLTRFDEGEGYEAWGGANDKKWHPPAASIAFVMEGKGELSIAEVKATLKPEKIFSLCRIDSASLGNIFVQGDQPQFKIETQAIEIGYSVQDVTDHVLETGRITPENGVAAFLPKVTALGCYKARLELKFKSLAPMKKELDFAILRRFDGLEMAQSPFGAASHFAEGWQTDRIQLLPKYGIGSVRDELYWDDVEKSRGSFSFEKQDLYMRKFAPAKVSPLVILTFENKLYDGGMTPCSPQGYDGYGRYAQQILKHYGPQIKWLEVWNEYNGSFCKGKAEKDRPRCYTEMLKAAYGQIKADRPDVKVLGAACVLIPMPYLESLFKAGALPYMDAVVIHPYRSVPEGVDREIAELRELIRKYNGGQEKPIWATEYGYDISRAGSRLNIAKYLVRTSALMLSENVERMYWYLFADHAEFNTMGLVQAADSTAGRYAPNPAGVAFANMAWLLHDAKHQGRELASPLAACQVHKFVKTSGQPIRVCWATYPTTILVESDGPLVKSDVVGTESPLDLKAGKAEIALDDSPIYLIGPVKNIALKPSAETIVADSVVEYSRTQGDHSWRYGYFVGKGTAPYSHDGFKEMHPVTNVWGTQWGGDHEYLVLSADGGHPALASGELVWAVRRWQSTLAGKVRLEGRIAVPDKGSDGVELVIVADGKPVLKKLVRPSDDNAGVAFTGEIEVRKDSLVDFAVNAGPKKNLSADAFEFKVRIIGRIAH